MGGNVDDLKSRAKAAAFDLTNDPDQAREAPPSERVKELVERVKAEAKGLVDDVEDKLRGKD